MLNVGRIEVRQPVSKMTGFVLSYFVLTPGPVIVFPTDPLRKDPDVEIARYEILIFNACIIQPFNLKIYHNLHIVQIYSFLDVFKWKMCIRT